MNLQKSTENLSSHRAEINKSEEERERIKTHQIEVY